MLQHRDLDLLLTVSGYRLLSTPHHRELQLRDEAGHREDPYGSTQILPDALVDELNRVREKIEVVGEQLRELVSRIPEPER